MTQLQIAASPIKSIVINALLMLGVASAGADILQNGSSRTGQIHALTVFARFADESDLGEEVPAFAAGIFAAEQPGSLPHFYREMSRGQFQLTGEILPRWYAARSESAAYVAPNGNFGDFVREVLEAVDDDVDLGLYDNDGPDGAPNSGDDDGYVDFFFVVTRSAPQGFIIDAATGVAQLGLGSDFTSKDPARRGGSIRVRADSGSGGVGGTIQRGRSLVEAVGSMAHELGHFLLLPDLYDLDYDADTELGPVDDSGGIGYWGLMGHGNRGWDDAGGPNPFSVWSLGQLGWLGVANGQLEILSEDLDDAVFEDVNAGGTVYMLPEPDGLGFFLVEFRSRQTSYYERNLPAEGLLIWHVNTVRGSNDLESAKLLDLVCADGLYADAGFPLGSKPSPFSGRDNLDYWAHDEDYRIAFGGNLGDATDVFDGERFTGFWAASNPASSPGISVSNIRSQGERMVADLKLRDPRRAGPIDTDQVWSDRIELVGDITVLPGSHLDILAGTEILVGPDALRVGEDLDRVELVVYGTLTTNILGREQTVFRSLAADPRPGDWQGIRLGQPGSAFLRQTRIEHARYGLFAEKLNRALTLEEVEIFRAGEDGIHLEEVLEEIELNGVLVEESGGIGIMVAGPGLTRGRLIDSRSNGVAGFLRQGGFLELVDSRFSDNGLAAVDGANLFLGREVSGRVANSAFSGGVGIRCVETREVIIADNILSNHQVGILSISARPRITGNQFNRNELAFQVEGVAVPARLDLNVVQNTERLLESGANRPLTATNNWWGQTDANWIEARVSGDVQWRPFLNFDPRVPLAFALKQNYPNPFNGTTRIDYQIGINDPVVAGLTQVTVEVRTITGGLVRRLVDELASPGFYSTQWDGRNQQGERVASGTYYYQLKIGPIVQLNKLLFLK